jgi:hypothetical protein
MNVDEKSKNSELLRIHVGHLMVIPDDIHKVNLLTVQRVRMGIGMRRKKKKKGEFEHVGLNVISQNYN